MSSTPKVTQRDFVQTLAQDGGTVDPTDLSHPLKTQLDEMGIEPEALTKIAGDDGKISGEREFNALFRLVDSFDEGGVDRGFLLATPGEADETVPTQSGALYDELQAEVNTQRLIAQGVATKTQFLEDMGAAKEVHGVLDVNHLDPNLEAQMGTIGIQRSELEALAGPDNQIKGDEFQDLFELVEGTDGRADGVLSGKIANSRREVRDTPQGLVQAGIQQSVDQNRNDPKYARPGAHPVPTQTPLFVEADALKVPQADQKPPVALNMPGINQYEKKEDGSHRYDNPDNACARASYDQTTEFNRSHLGRAAPRMKGMDQAIQMAYAEDEHGLLAVDSTQAALGRDYIDRCLDQGLPVMVGVSYKDQAINKDQLTDHFVTIDGRGYDDEGRLFYTFKDPGARAKEFKAHVDQVTGKLFKEGDNLRPIVESADYQFTHVRTYEGID